jgi:hypothetical protein
MHSSNKYGNYTVRHMDASKTTTGLKLIKNTTKIANNCWRVHVTKKPREMISVWFVSAVNGPPSYQIRKKKHIGGRA